MKALSIQQPWAFCITNGTKRIENRTWYSSYRGLLLIHAGKNAQKGIEHEIALDSPEMAVGAMRIAPRGAIVGIATMVDCVRVDRVVPDQRIWAGGPWCFVLDDPMPLPEIIPYRGALGIFEVPNSIVMQQLWALGIRTAA